MIIYSNNEPLLYFWVQTNDDGIAVSSIDILLYSLLDNKWLDFHDNQFKTTGWLLKRAEAVDCGENLYKYGLATAWVANNQIIVPKFLINWDDGTTTIQSGEAIKKQAGNPVTVSGFTQDFLNTFVGLLADRVNQVVNKDWVTKNRRGKNCSN